MGGLLTWSWAILLSTKFISLHGIKVVPVSPNIWLHIKLLTLQMFSPAWKGGCEEVPRRRLMGWVVSLYDLEQSSTHELAFGVELDQRFSSLEKKKHFTEFIMQVEGRYSRSTRN